MSFITIFQANSVGMNTSYNTYFINLYATDISTFKLWNWVFYVKNTTNGLFT